jgi:outer membrane lipopolysaccharide assembly protein LptE/RlpB
MAVQMKKAFGILLVVMLAGCGYSARSALPARLKTIYIESFKNKIDYTSERLQEIYLPLLEVKVRDAIVKRYMFDGNLRITDPDKADLILKGELVGYQKEPLRHTENQDVEEYRVRILVNLILWDSEEGEPMWTEGGFAGEGDYFVSGPNAKSEDSAVQAAMTDLARRIVERTVEYW